MAYGEWESARRYMWAAVDAYETWWPSMCKLELGRLAWLEDDPEKAARLLRLSCQGEFKVPDSLQDEHPDIADSHASMALANAIKLCKKTGSATLAEHYLARLRSEYPAQAKEYEKRISVRSGN